MDTSPDFLRHPATRAAPGVTARVWLTGLALAVAAAVGVALVLRFVAAERDRDLRAWQLTLGIVADSRAAAVESWLGRQWSEVAGVAGNESVRLYMTELAAAGGDARSVADGEGRAEYLQNFLTVTGDRSEFSGPLLGPDVAANVGRMGVAGLAIVDLQGRLVMGTRGVPAGDQAMQAFVAGTAPGARGFRDLFLDAAGQPSLALLEPVYRIQGQATADDQVAWVLGVREVGAALYPLLRQPGATEATAEAVLVRRRGAVIEYLSPLADGHGPLSLSLATNTAELDAAAALAAPGGFDAKRDYRDRLVLFTSRAIAGTPWLLIYKIDSDEALADTDRRQQRLLTIFLLAILLTTAGLVAIWRHGASQRAAAAADHYQSVARELDRQQKFLRLVTDSQPHTIVIVDGEGRYRFANRRAGEDAGVPQTDLIGKTVTAVYGPETGKYYEQLDRDALDSQEARSAVHRVATGVGERVLQSHHIPLPSGLDGPNDVLIVEQDITAAIAEHKRLEGTLRHLIENLVALVDRRDPFAAHHSSRVAALARATAEEMGLDAVLIDTAEIAGRLLNLGKVLVPVSILTKAENLSDEEIAEVRNTLQAGADFLEGIAFEGPVVETLRQAQEHWDGTGRPRGLGGDAILPTARIVAVANSFVAMISTRAHRPGLTIDQAVAELLAQIGRRFDRGTVAALLNYLDNKGGRAAVSRDAARFNDNRS